MVFFDDKFLSFPGLDSVTTLHYTKKNYQNEPNLARNKLNTP